MAITAIRPDGATHFNRFSGSIVQAVGNTTPSGEVPSGSPIPGPPVLVKFGPLAMPGVVFDDSGTPGGVGAGEQEGFGPHATIDDRTWAKNTVVTAVALDGNTINLALDPQNWELDATTGLPVLRLLMSFAALPAVVDIQVEVKHSVGR